jgi:hypothetical protein
MKSFGFDDQLPKNARVSTRRVVSPEWVEPVVPAEEEPMEENHGQRPRYDVHGDLHVQELLDMVRKGGLPDVAESIEKLLGKAGAELQILREFVGSVRGTHDMLTDQFAEVEGTGGVKALVASIRTVLAEDLEEVPV